jgi:anti-sigma factor ChrR (cupin superfamily)
MYETMLETGTIPWTPLDFPGVEMKVLRKDEATGAMAVLTRIGPGGEIPAHRHTNADETVYVLEGDFIEAGTSYGPGAFFAGKAGTPHGPHRSRGGCVVLTDFSGELDFQLVEP